jgi:hypothetical protein
VVEHRPYKAVVAGSIPAASTMNIKKELEYIKFHRHNNLYIRQFLKKIFKEIFDTDQSIHKLTWSVEGFMGVEPSIY